MQQQEHPWIYHIQRGFVLLYGVSLSGKQGITDLYGPGSWFGPGLSDGIAAQSAKARAGCVLQRFDAEALQAHLAQNGEQLKQFFQQLAMREKQLQQRLFLQQTASLPVRLAQLLIYLFGFQSQPCEHGHDRDMSLSQQELAAMVGGSRQTVSQLLAQWKQAGIIDYTRSFICLENADALQALSDE